MTNFMTYLIFQMLVSVGMMTCYAIVSLTMDHNVCNFDINDYETGMDLPIYNNIEDAPNITTTVQLTFIIGLILHTSLFIHNVFLETFFRFERPAISTQGDIYNQVDP